MDEVTKYFEGDVFKRLNISYRIDRIIKRFLFGNTITNAPEEILMLWPFIEHPILKYIDGSIFEVSKSFLEQNKDLLFETFEVYSQDITKAIFSLLSYNKELLDEESISDLSVENIIKFETVFHPEYIRIIEFTYNKLLKIFIYILKKITPSKSYDVEADLAVKISILKSNRLSELIKWCDVNIRNAIAHGTVYFDMHQIEYKKDNYCKSLLPFEFMKLFDGLLNSCSAILLSIYIITLNSIELRPLKDRKIPLGIMYSYLSSLLEHHGLKYKYALESKANPKLNQLFLEIEITSKARILHIQESLKFVYYLTKLFSHNYDRIGVQINCGAKLRSSIFIDANKFKSYSQSGNLNDIVSSIDTNLLWHDESINKRRIWTMKNIIKYQIYSIKKTFDENMENNGINVFINRYIIKKVEDRSTEGIGRIYVHIVLTKEINDLIKKPPQFIAFLYHIIKKHKRYTFLNAGKLEHRKKFIKPTYIWGCFYRQNLQFRNLISLDNRLIEFEWIAKKKKNMPILLKNENIRGGLRFKFHEK